MRTTIAAFSLFSLALGAINWSALESCVTESGTASVKSVSTSMSTTTVQQPDVHVKHTVQPKPWLVTPKPFTKTWTHTFHETDTALSTVTVHLTTTEWVPSSTIISTATQTHVSNVYTTIAAPVGFLPVSNTTNSAYPAGQSGSQSSSSPSAAKSSTAVSHSNGTASAGASAGASAEIEARSPKNIKQFAHVVHCLKSVLVQKTIDITTTVATQTSTLAQATFSTTVSTTVTAMVQPKFGHGKTVYTTSWTTVTKNYNVHSTQTVTAQVTSTVKVYAACQTNNILQPVASISNGKTKFKTVVASSAQKCCEQCQETSNCVGSAYQALLPLGGRCLIYYADSCPAQSANSLQYMTPAPKSGSLGSFAVSNGLCGYMFSGGQASSHGHGW